MYECLRKVREAMETVYERAEGEERAGKSRQMVGRKPEEGAITEF